MRLLKPDMAHTSMAEAQSFAFSYSLHPIADAERSKNEYIPTHVHYSESLLSLEYFHCNILFSFLASRYRRLDIEEYTNPLICH
jgi:hypothetical protein